VLDRKTFIQITESEFLDIEAAKDGLLQALFIEEKFDLVIENLLDLESTMLNSAMRGAYLHDQDWESYQEERGLLNRRLINLLTAARIYIDHVKHHVKRVFSDAHEEASAPDLKNLFSREYDARLGFRAGEALRNFVQHRGFPVHGITFEMRRMDRAGEDLANLRCGLSPYLLPEELREDGDFKKSVLKELELLGNKVDLKMLVRDYVEGIANIHNDIRERVQPRVDRWEEKITAAIVLFKQESPEEGVIALSAIKRNDDGQSLRTVQIFAEFMEYRRTLRKKNSSFQSLGKKYITSEVIAQ
jgi:hypothetical protein